MKHDVKVPTVGESIAEVVIAQWLKADGDQVEIDELICEIESDKASFEIPAEKSGILTHKAAEGDTVAIGAVVATIDESATSDKPASSTEADAPTSAPAKSSNSEPAAPAAAATGGDFAVVIPTVGESINEVVIAQWLKADGESVTADELICEIESDKASFEIPAGRAGILHHQAKEGATVAIGATIASIAASGAPAAAPAAAETGKTPTASHNGSEKKRVSPVAANILSEAGISPENVQGSGPGGKVTKDDALRALQAKPAAAKTEAPAAPVEPPAARVQPTVVGAERGERRERMSTLRRTIARRLVAAKNETAMLTTFNEVDMSAIMELRKRYKESFKEKHEVGLGFMSFFTKACCLALSEWPAVNAYLDDKHILYHDYCDISIAVSTPRGLVVPVIRNADKMSPAEIEQAIVDLATRARNNKLSIDEMTGGTFTITNGGVFGSLLSTPILNQPQSAILGMHKIEQRPIALNGEVVIRPMMYLALSYDHRIVDGRESVGFLVRVKELLEDPARMLLQI